MNNDILVGLSELDSNKCKAILRYRHQIEERIQCFSSSTPAQETAKERKQLDKFGEVSISYLQQSYHIEFSKEEIEQIISSYQSGESTRKLAEQFSCSKTTISTLLKHHGIAVTNCKVQARLDSVKIISMYHEMHTTEEIAKIFGVSPSTINRCLRRNGVKIRSRWDYKKNDSNLSKDF